MLSLALILEFPTFTNHKISITLLIFPKCRGAVTTSPSAKLQKIRNTVIDSQEKTAYLQLLPEKCGNADNAGPNLDFYQFVGQISLSDAQFLRLILPLSGDMSDIWLHRVVCCL